MPQEDAKKERPLHEQRLIATASNAADVQHDAMPNWAALIVEGIEEVLFSVDNEWRFTYLNAQASLIWGMPREALLGKVMWEAFPSLGGSGFERLYRQVMDERRPGRLEDFSPVRQAWYDVRAYPIPHGLLVHFQDITTRKRAEAERTRAEAELRNSEGRFKILSEATNEALFIHENGKILDANQRAGTLFGYTLDELIDTSLTRVFPPQSLIRLRQGFKADQEFTDESTAVCKDGTQLVVEVHGRPIEYQGKQVRLVAIRDITSLKQAEDTLRKTQAQLLQSQKMESLGQLAGGIAHDFNNLLTGILGYCELILESLQETEPLYAEVHEIYKAGKRAATLVRQILAFSRQQVLDAQLVNLNEAVANLDNLLHRVIGEDVELVSLLDPHLDLVLVDLSQIEQVIMNLAVNARDAMPDGGQLTIETTNVELNEHYQWAGRPDVKTGPYVMLAVSDTGSGMDQATQEKIFEPFFTTKGPGKGTGLGLATVYGIVHQSEGHIWVYSELGVGTAFKIYIPTVKDLALAGVDARPNAQPDVSAPPPSTDRSGKGCTILVVEDDAFVRNFIDRVLSQAGYTVLATQNGQEALDQIAGYFDPIDVVLTDIVMPQMGGQALAEHLRQQRAHLKILCMSGYTDRAVLHHGILRQYNAFLQKPFTPEALLRRISDVLNAPPGQA